METTLCIADFVVHLFRTATVAGTHRNTVQMSKTGLITSLHQVNGDHLHFHELELFVASQTLHISHPGATVLFCHLLPFLAIACHRAFPRQEASGKPASATNKSNDKYKWSPYYSPLFYYTILFYYYNIVLQHNNNKNTTHSNTHANSNAAPTAAATATMKTIPPFCWALSYSSSYFYSPMHTKLNGLWHLALPHFNLTQE